MSDKRKVDNSRVEPSGSALPEWWLMASRELTDLWIGGKVFILLILFSILLGVMSFLLATDIELRVIPPKEMVFLTLQVTIAVGLFIGLIIGADSISGERERATLEGILLTPASRRQIVIGKFLTAVTPWPAVLAISSPYMAILSSDGDVLSLALLWGALLGSLLVLAFTGFAMLVSIRSNSNMTSLSLSLFIYLLFLLPTQFPGTGAVAQFIQKVNPVEATNQFLLKVLVNNRTPDELGSWLVAPVLFAALVLGHLFWYAGPRLRLHGGKASMSRLDSGRGISLLVTACLMVSLGTPATMAHQTAESNDPKPSLQITINMDYKVVKTADKFGFDTQVTYHGRQKSPPMVVAMNIVNLRDGDPVDPEDWSPERAQYIGHLRPGQSAKQTWTIHAIVEGSYMVYMVVIPEPDGIEVTSQPVASSGMHLTVTPFTRLNPGGVLPLAIGMPIGLTLGMSLLRWRRRRGIDTGGS